MVSLIAGICIGVGIILLLGAAAIAVVVYLQQTATKAAADKAAADKTTADKTTADKATADKAAADKAAADKASADKASADKASADKATADAAKVVPFATLPETNTGWNDYGNGDPIYLDRHPIDCANSALNKFQLGVNAIAPTQMKFYYQCASGGNLGSPVSKATTLSESGPNSKESSTMFLDRHDVNCGSGNVLTKLRIVNGANRTWQIQYACAPSTRPLTCRDVETTMSDAPGTSNYLDRHNVQCGPTEALSRVRLATSWSPTQKQQFKYTCCS